MLLVSLAVFAAYCQAKPIQSYPVQVEDSPLIAVAKKAHALQWLNAKSATDAANLIDRSIDHEKSIAIQRLLMASYIYGSHPAVAPYVKSLDFLPERKLSEHSSQQFKPSPGAIT